MSEQNLKPHLNLFDATVLVIGSVVGSGIFLTTGHIAGYLPSPGWILFVWLLGTILTLFGGLTFAELGAMIPEAGGQYAYLRESYGPFAGFMYGWTTFLVTHTGGIAALGVGFAEYLSYFLPGLGLDQYSLLGTILPISNGQIVALLSIALLTAVNFYGIRSGNVVQNIFTVFKIIAIAILVIAGLAFTAGTAESTSVQHTVPGGFGLISAVGISLIAVLWTFDGWYSVSCVASEIKNVKKNLPISLILGISLTGLIYLAINYYYVHSLPIPEMVGVERIGEKATSFMFGPDVGKIMSALILVSIFGCLSATVIFGPRIFYAMAEDRLFFRSFARVHPRHNSPHVAIIGQGIWSGLLCLTGTYEQLYTYVVFVLLLFYIATAIGVFILRSKRPHAERPYKVWGYPFVPVLFALAMFWIMMNTFFEKPVEAFFGIILVLTGVPIYVFWRKR